MGGFVVTLGLQTWQHRLPIDGGSFLGLLGIVGVGTIFAYTAFLKGVSMVGPVNGSLLASIEPIASVFLQYGWSMSNFMQLILLECC